MNIDLTKAAAGTVEALSTTSPHSGSSDSGSDTDDDQKPAISDKPNSQVSLLSQSALLRSLTLLSEDYLQ